MRRHTGHLRSQHLNWIARSSASIRLVPDRCFSRAASAQSREPRFLFRICIRVRANTLSRLSEESQKSGDSERNCSFSLSRSRGIPSAAIASIALEFDVRFGMAVSSSRSIRELGRFPLRRRNRNFLARCAIETLSLVDGFLSEILSLPAMARIHIARAAGSVSRLSRWKHRPRLSETSSTLLQLVHQRCVWKKKSTGVLCLESSLSC